MQKISKILLVSHNAELNGATKVLVNFWFYAFDLLDGHFVTFGRGKINDLLNDRGLNSQSLWASSLTVFPKKFIVAQALDIFLLPVYLAHLIYIIKTRRIKCILWNTSTRIYIAVLVAMILKVKLIVYVHEPRVYFDKRNIFKILLKFWYRKVDKFIILSDAHIDILKDLGIKNEIHCVMNGLPMDFYKNTKPKSRYRQLRKIKEIRILFWASEKNYRKGFDLFLLACSKLSSTFNIKCMVAGNETIETARIIEKKNELISYHDLRFADINFLDFDEIDIVICPSRSEAQPLSIIEMAALKVPMIISDLPENKTIWPMNCCWYFSVGSAGSLMGAIEEVISSSISDIREKTERSRALAKHKFVSEKGFDKILKIVGRS